MSKVMEEVTKSVFLERESDIKHPTYDAEMAFYNLIADGKLNEVRDSWDKAPRSDAEERGVLSDDPVVNAKYHMVAMTAIITRVCIGKGMPQDIAYKISDVYIRKADSARTVDDVRMVQWDMVQNFTQYSIESKQSQINSKQIRQCINYIREHAHDSITVSEIAESVGLNETYLSKLFKKVMGCTVSEYIRNEKIAEACYLLTYTDKTSIEIATDLSFSSHSYFISVFKKVKGITPKEYRNQNREMK